MFAARGHRIATVYASIILVKPAARERETEGLEH